MGAIMSGIVAAIAFAVFAAFTLSAVQEPVYKKYSSTSTRLGDPGYNLVGETWSGDPSIQRNGT